jgi:hypothetical protein
MANLTDIERLNYYEGEFLGATDFQAEQEYHRDMRRRHNLGQHTWGIVTGLDLAQAPNGGTSPTGATEVDVYLQPGMAVDGFGREMVVLSQTQITPTMLAAFYSSSPIAPQWIYVWISYQQSLLQPTSDSCASMNVSNAFGRIGETYTLSFTSTKTSQPNDPIVVDGNDTTPPSQSSSSGSTTVTDPPAITLPFDDSIPFQEFSTDDSSLVWWVCVGRVLWDPYNEVFVQIDPNPQKAAASAGTGREYACNVSAGVYAPAVNYFIADRATGYPMPPSLLKPPYGGVQAEIAGFLQVDCVLSVLGDALIGSAYDPTSTTPLSPLTIVANGTNEELIQFRNPSNQETWHICENLNGNTPGLNIIEVDSAGNDVDARIFIQPTQTSSSLPSPQNVGIGTMKPRNPLAVRGQGSWSELLSFEDNSGTTQWHMNHNPQGNDAYGSPVTPGLNFCETQANANFRLFLKLGGNVGVGTPSPQQNLSVNTGLSIDWANGNPGGASFIGGPNNMLTFGNGSGEGIGSSRQGTVNDNSTNKYGLDFYTAFNRRMYIAQNGDVHILGHLFANGTQLA